MSTRKILFLAASLLFINCGSDISYEQQIKNYNYYVNKSDSLIKIEKYKESFGYSNAAIEITDTIPNAFYLKGVASFKLNWFEESEEFFSEVIELEGEKSLAYKDRAKVYFKTGDSDFLDDIDIFIKNYPNDEEALKLKRDYLESKEDYDNAITEYNLAISKNKSDTLLLAKRANLFFKNGDYKKSIIDYEQILKLYPNNENIKTKRNNILVLINKNNNRNILIGLLVAIYIIYIVISIFVLKPIVNKKAISQIGGKFELSKDPLIWVLPIILSITFLTLLFTNSVPNF